MVTCHQDQMRSYTTRYPAKLLKSQKRGSKRTRKVSQDVFPAIVMYLYMYCLYVVSKVFKFCYYFSFVLMYGYIIYNNYRYLKWRKIKLNCTIITICKHMQSCLASLNIFTELKTRKSHWKGGEWEAQWPHG